jgi:hypothetical protein
LAVYGDNLGTEQLFCVQSSVINNDGAATDLTSSSLKGSMWERFMYAMSKMRVILCNRRSSAIESIWWSLVQTCIQ